jgi:gamma-glutamyltranspeptidase/glutathione hydrolase
MHQRQLCGCIHHSFNLPAARGGGAIVSCAMQAAVAGGHPATVAAGIIVLEDGGTAADAAVAASLASCVTETVMTGLLGGGHAVYYEAASGRVRNLDCFVAVPGLGDGPRKAELIHLDVPFGAELVHYAVGPASCAVPGLPAGLEALWREHGRLPWQRLVEPALQLARDGVDFPLAHATCLAMLAPVMTMNEGAAIYAPGGKLLQAGDRLEQPGLVAALEALADDAATVYRGAIAIELLALSAERGGLLNRADFDAYEARWTEPVEIGYAGGRLVTRGGLSAVPETVPRLPRLYGLDETERVLALVGAFGTPVDLHGDTTNVSVVDRDGNACAFTSSLGLGSGDFIPGLDLHLNSMLGEADLLRGRLEPGSRMQSMMAPLLAFDGDGLSLAAGAAGGTRLRTALLSVVAGILDEGLAAGAAVERARFHAVPDVVNAEPGVDEAALDELQRNGLTVRRWPAPHHYFGGVSVVSRAGAAGDPRRSGAASTPR